MTRRPPRSTLTAPLFPNTTLFRSPESIRRVIADYAKVRGNLVLHDPAYPPATTIEALVGTGQTVYGMAGIGQGKDTEGSRRIIAELNKPDPRPLWIAGWGDRKSTRLNSSH